jgi:hypothetical protein
MGEFVEYTSLNRSKKQAKNAEEQLLRRSADHPPSMRFRNPLLP